MFFRPWKSAFKELRGKLLHDARDFYAKLEDSLKLQTDQASRRELARAYYEVGELTSRMDSLEDAMTVHRQALALRRELLSESPNAPELLAENADSLNAIGLIQSRTGHPAEALQSFHEAREIRERLTAGDPANNQFQDDLANSDLKIGWEWARSGAPPKPW